MICNIEQGSYLVCHLIYIAKQKLPCSLFHIIILSKDIAQDIFYGDEFMHRGAFCQQYQARQLFRLPIDSHCKAIAALSVFSSEDIAHMESLRIEARFDSVF